jgi:hypothetical protein
MCNRPPFKILIIDFLMRNSFIFKGATLLYVAAAIGHPYVTKQLIGARIFKTKWDPALPFWRK